VRKKAAADLNPARRRWLAGPLADIRHAVYFRLFPVGDLNLLFT
jgi:hypothetical protein